MNRLFSVIIMISVLLLISFTGCKQDDFPISGSDISTASPTPTAAKKTLNGAVQKGPYLNGTSLTFFELTETLGQTGKSYNGQIRDNTGTYTLKDIQFTSDYVMIKADGYYFNEVSGDTSASVLTLYALSDITDKSTVNVNLISHLEKDRVEYLVETGIGLAEAKNKAQAEILDIFSLAIDGSVESELLSISEAGENNAKLLAISIILQGLRTTGELSELLANISTDIRTDGILSSPELGSQLVNDIARIERTGRLAKIRDNLEKRYSEIGIVAQVPDFEKYVQQFLQTTHYEIISLIYYPEQTDYGINLLGSVTDISIDQSGEFFHQTFAQTSQVFSIAAKLTDVDSLKIIIKTYNGFNWDWSPLADYPIENDHWEYTHEVVNDNYPQGSFTKSFAQFETTVKDKLCDAKVIIMPVPGKFLIEYYEDGSEFPTYTKVLNITFR